MIYYKNNTFEKGAPPLDEEAFKTNVDKFKGVIENGGGVIESVGFWGKRKLAYEI